jgi:predicted DNA-binding protein (MmcQ/YjbR family)
MNFEQFQKYCLSKKGVTEELPFGEYNPAYKVGGKIFAITSFSLPLSVNLKCDPELAIELREQHEEVEPGYHMNKKHWNTVNFNGRISNKELQNMVDHSYELVVKSLNKKLREQLNKTN